MSSSANRSQSMRCAQPLANFSMPRNSPILIRLVRWPALILSLALIFRGPARADFLEKVHDTLSLGDPDHRFHLQLSGLFDLETYFIDRPAPALIFADRKFLLN